MPPLGKLPDGYRARVAACTSPYGPSPLRTPRYGPNPERRPSGHQDAARAGDGFRVRPASVGFDQPPQSRRYRPDREPDPAHGTDMHGIEPLPGSAARHHPRPADEPAVPERPLEAPPVRQRHDALPVRTAAIPPAFVAAPVG